MYKLGHCSMHWRHTYIHFIPPNKSHELFCLRGYEWLNGKITKLCMLYSCIYACYICMLYNSFSLNLATTAHHVKGKYFENCMNSIFSKDPRHSWQRFFNEQEIVMRCLHWKHRRAWVGEGTWYTRHKSQGCVKQRYVILKPRMTVWPCAPAQTVRLMGQYCSATSLVVPHHHAVPPPYPSVSQRVDILFKHIAHWVFTNNKVAQSSAKHLLALLFS